MARYAAGVLKAPREVIVAGRRVRRLKPSEVLIRVMYAGICGTDLALYDGDYRVPLPLVLGHEFIGVVEQVGSDEFVRLLGKRATAEINNTCLSYSLARPCEACQRGFEHHCLRRTVTGIVGHDGAFAEFIIVPGRNVHLIPRAISAKEAIFVEPLAAALQTFRLTPIVGGERIVVLGAGRLGLLVGVVARAKGAKVLMVTRSDAKRRKARHFGLECICGDQTSELSRRVKRWTGRMGADIVVEATGGTDMIGVALELVRPRGTIALKSTPGTPARHVDLTRAVVNEVQIQGSRCGDFCEALAFMSKAKTRLETLIEDVLPLEEIRAALDSARRQSKILLTCSQ